MKVSPKSDKLVISNHRNELLLIDLKKSSLYKIDKSSNQNIGSNFNWSPCGNFIAYSCSFSSKLYGIKIFDLKK